MTPTILDFQSINLTKNVDQNFLRNIRVKGGLGKKTVTLLTRIQI